MLGKIFEFRMLPEEKLRDGLHGLLAFDGSVYTLNSQGDIFFPAVDEDGYVWMRLHIFVLLGILSGKEIEFHGSVVHKQGHLRAKGFDAVRGGQDAKLLVSDQIVDDLHFFLAHERTLLHNCAKHY